MGLCWCLVTLNGPLSLSPSFLFSPPPPIDMLAVALKNEDKAEFRREQYKRERKTMFFGLFGGGGDDSSDKSKTDSAATPSSK